MRNSHFLTFITLILFTFTGSAQEVPLKVGIIGLSHSHVHGILGREDKGDIEIVGIVETNRDLAQRFSNQYKFSMDLIYDTMEAMFQAARPEAVTAFGNIYDHLSVVSACAPLGIHVMVEKPLAVSLDHAKKMEALALKHNIQLLTNYETTWYPSNHQAIKLLKEGKIGPLRKVVVRDGHKGPVGIGVNKEFLEWLTDPELNGAGALMDFGCYGANLVTWMHGGKKPITVTAVTQQLQKENNPKVDDEANIILTYDNSNALIQASWNWPVGRKDMELYGTTGVLYSDNKNDLRLRISEGYDGFDETTVAVEPLMEGYDDPFAMLHAVIKKGMKLPPYEPTTLENNMVVMEILDAAIRSVETESVIRLKP